MEFTKEFIEKNQLTEEQVNAVTSFAKDQIANIEKEWSGKANENAEKILEGAASSLEKLTGIQREKGQKIAEYTSFAVEKYFEGTKNELQRQKGELEEKLKSNKGDELLKAELAETKEAIKALKQKEAEYDEWVKNDYKGKYEKTSQELTLTQQRIAFKDNIPLRPENVNKYEWDAKIKEFQNELLEKNNLVFDGDVAWLVDKENEFKKTKLEDAVKANETIQELIKGRVIEGAGGKAGKQINIEGVPFKVPENATSEQRTKAIRDYLAGQNITTLSPDYPKKFAELNAKILEKNPTK